MHSRLAAVVRLSVVREYRITRLIIKSSFMIPQAGDFWCYKAVTAANIIK
jgi:hypothetical protein